MKNPMIVVLSLAFAFLALSSAPFTARAVESHDSYVPQELIVCFRPGISVPDRSISGKGAMVEANAVLDELVREKGLVAVERLIPDDLPRLSEKLAARGLPKLDGRFPTDEEVAAIFHHYGLDRTVLLRFTEHVDPLELAGQMMRRYPDSVEYAEPNYIRELEVEPNDPRFRSQYHLLHRTSDESRRADIRAPEAWEITRGSSEVAIAVLDTGATFDHQDLGGKFLPGRSFVGGGSPTDGNGHGTGVAGVAAANTDNGLDVAGVCWDCRVVPYRVCTNGCPLSAITSGIGQAVRDSSRYGIKVINLSLGGSSNTRSELSAVQSAQAAGILCVASSGNGGDDGIGDDNDEIPHFPSQYSIELDNMVAVASSGRTNRMSQFSNYGRESVTLAAPGEAIWTTVPTDSGLELGNAGGIAPLTGTSFSSPVVAGIAGLIYSQFPGITASQVRARLEGSVDRFSDFLEQTSSGGRVNALRALETDLVPPAMIADLQAQGGNAVRLTWTAPGDDGSDGQAMFYDIRFSRNEITEENFDRAARVLFAPFPGTAGDPETFSFDLSRATYFVALRAVDNVGNKGPISDVIMVTVN